MKPADYYFTITDPSQTQCRSSGPHSIPYNNTCNKVGAIKAYRLLTGEGLKESKIAVEQAIRGDKWIPIHLNQNDLVDLTEEQALEVHTRSAEQLRNEGFDVVSVSDLIKRIDSDAHPRSGSLRDSIRKAVVRALEQEQDHTALRLLETLVDINDVT